MNTAAHNFADQSFENHTLDPAMMDAIMDGEIAPKAALKRALWACLLGALGLLICIVLFTFSPFDSSMDTAGIAAQSEGGFSNILGRPGANLANFLLQSLGWAAFPAGVLMIFGAGRAVIKPRLHITRLDTVRRSFHL